jgi:hypothetical protein
MSRFLFAFAVTFAACGIPPEPEPVSTTSSAVVAAPVGSQLPGYRHSPSASKFRLGANVRSDRVFEFDRVVGDEGVIAIGRHGVLLGVPNADAPSTKTAPYSNVAAVHDARVLRYFKEAGLPEDQVGPTHVTTVIEATGAVSDALNGPVKPHLVGYNTVIDRQVQGVRVAGSYAWARFNANDEVVSEEVFWPELPAKLVEQAETLKVALTSKSARTNLAEKLPVEFKDQAGEVVIHHSPHFQDQFETFVSVDFQTTKAAERRFGLDGSEFRFAFEASPALDTSTGKP